MLEVNGINVVQGRFPNSEIDYNPDALDIMKADYQDKRFHFRFNLVFEGNEDLANLVIVKNMLDSIAVCKKECSLLIKFFPYAQMDRDMPSHLFSLKGVAKMINDLKFDYICVCDPHSNVLPGMLNNCLCRYPVLTDIDFNNYDLAFYPDNGAAKKYSEIIDGIPYRFGYKKRDLKTGEIIKYEILAEKEDIEGKKVIIVDDLCMGGRTFKEAAKALKDLGASKVDMYVTHLMPQSRNFYRSKGDGMLDNIFSADTLGQIPYFETPEPRP